MMYKPISPCVKGCTERDIGYCINCEKEKAYRAELVKYYEAEYSRKSVDRAVTDNIGKIIKKKHKKQGYNNFHYK